MMSATIFPAYWSQVEYARKPSYLHLQGSPFVLEHRVDVRWGNLSQIRTEYALLEEALKHGSYEYYHILSGQDLPIKTQDEIHQFFHEHRGKEFVGINRGEEFEWDCRRKMMRCWLLTRYTRTRWGWFNGITRRINKYLSLCWCLLFTARKWILPREPTG